MRTEEEKEEIRAEKLIDEILFEKEMKTIIFNDEGEELNFVELKLVLNALNNFEEKKIKLYGQGKDFWFFDNSDTCFIWDSNKLMFREAVGECEFCGTFILEGKLCKDCDEGVKYGKI